MRYQKDWKRPVKISDPDCDPKYSDRLEFYPNEFKGECFDTKVVYARTKIVKFVDNNGATHECEVLTLALELLKPVNGYYVSMDIWGARKHENGDWGDNPVELQDMLYIARMQKTEVDVCEHYHYSTDWGEGDVYPHLCGVKFKLIAAKKGIRMSKKGKMFDDNILALYAPDGRSALEIENSVALEQKQDIRLAYKNAKNAYADWCKDNEVPAADYGQVQAAQPTAPAAPSASAPAPAATATEPAQPNPPLDDDIPF